MNFGKATALSGLFFLRRGRFRAEPSQIKDDGSGWGAFFFRAQAVEEALRKDRDCPAEKETPKKGKGRGQASEKIRSPLHLTWKRVQARGAKVHACGAQTKLEFQEISGKVERVRGKS